MFFYKIYARLLLGSRKVQNLFLRLLRKLGLISADGAQKLVAVINLAFDGFFRILRNQIAVLISGENDGVAAQLAAVERRV